jgi:hypothetical protein
MIARAAKTRWPARKYQYGPQVMQSAAFDAWRDREEAP